MQRRNELKELVAITVLSVAVAVGLNCLLLFINLAKYSERYQEAAALLFAPPFWEQILYYGILIPIVEELIFRGVLFRILRKWIAFPWCAILSAVAFGIYHGNLVQLVYAGLCGILLAYLYEKYHSIIAPIWSHVAMNIFAILLTQTGGFAWIMESNQKALITIAGCGVVCGITLCKIQEMDVTKVLNIYCKKGANDI